MGWYYFSKLNERNDRKFFIAMLTKGMDTAVASRQCLAHCVRGNVLWSVWEIKRRDEPPFRWINCDLMQFGGYAYGWGHKPIDEDMGPNYYSCPLRYFKIAPNPQTQIARDWRSEVIRIHAEKRAQKKGQK